VLRTTVLADCNPPVTATFPRNMTSEYSRHYYQGEGSTSKDTPTPLAIRSAIGGSQPLLRLGSTAGFLRPLYEATDSTRPGSRTPESQHTTLPTSGITSQGFSVEESVPLSVPLAGHGLGTRLLSVRGSRTTLHPRSTPSITTRGSSWTTGAS